MLEDFDVLSCLMSHILLLTTTCLNANLINHLALGKSIEWLSKQDHFWSYQVTIYYPRLLFVGTLLSVYRVHHSQCHGWPN